MAAPSGTQKPTLATDAGTGSGTKVEKQPSVPGTSQPADGAGGGGSEEPPHVLDVARFRRLNWLIHRENVDADELLNLVGRDYRVNLMNDPLLSVVIACKKPKLACRLIAKISDARLTDSNYNGDTALHVAAAMDDQEVASELIRRVPNLVQVQNRKQEMPLHKAALYGLKDMFWLLVKKSSSPEARREDGATMLHCAIMGNAPVLALEIAKAYPFQIVSRNEHALTPLQQLVTIPEAFRSQVVLGALDSFIYEWIPLEEDSSKMNKRDEEAALNRSLAGFSDLFITLYGNVSYMSPRVQRLERKKKNHTETMHLIEYLAQARYFDFFVSGKDPTQGDAQKRDTVSRIPSEALDGVGKFGPSEPVQEGDAPKKDTEAPAAVKELIKGMTDKLYKLVSKESETPVSIAIKEAAQSVEKVLKALSPSSEGRWNEPPLILGAQMGLHDFVDKILQVYPQSATYLDTKGRNVLQVAIESGNRETVETIRRMTQGDNPILPSWLLSKIDSKTRNTILHFASEKVGDTGDDAVQMQDEIRWFEMVKEMVPKELVYSRNTDEKTAREIFTESHKEMFKNCKSQLMEMGKTCSGLVAAVVFASSFSIPGEKNSKTGNPEYFNRLPFKVFTHAYVIGLSCAATSLVLFLSLVISPYKEQQFRRAIPTKYFFACFSFGLALMALLVAFTCNIFLQIYGGQKTLTKDILQLVLELTVFPIVCFVVLLYRVEIRRRRRANELCAPNMGDPTLAHTDSIQDGTDDADPPHELNRSHFLTVKSHIRQKKHKELLALAEEDPCRPVNLMTDTLLHVVIACNKTDLAKSIIRQMPVDKLLVKNLYGDTALHVTAAVGNSGVAKELFDKREDLIGEQNLKQETPLHKAAFYGHHDMFWCLVDEGKGSPYDRREDGATMLHCAIMGNEPGLALEIAQRFPLLITSRNTMAVTPLQLMVTVPGLFRSQMVLGCFESILYDFIPLEKDSHRTRQRDEEEAPGSSNDAVKWVRLFLFIIIRTLCPRTRHLEKIKRTHRKALELIEFLARDPRNMEFYVLGRKQGDGGAPAAGFRERGEGQDQLNAPAASTRRWNEPPLILGAQMGIPEFVRTILRVCPEAATYLDTRGRSVLQVAIEHGNREIVRTIREMTRGKNPILPSWLLSRVDKRTGRTILHLASANAPEHNQDALQMQDELRWFETVRDMVPKELVYSRNAQEMTAEEMFTVSHRAMLKSCKGQLMETGRTCSGLVAAVVFASSFSIPGDKDPATGNPVYFGRAAFKVFSHAYVIGLSCAATSLVLFLSLAMSPYKEQQFRRIIPTKYFFARSSFAMAMLSFLVAFTCNIYLQIYGWQKAKSKDLIPFVLELTVFPVICSLVLFFRGSDVGLSFLVRLWR
ncbi:hypothetical protein C4D60_Mb02t18760 [Musa balbisiana]|uniref:PGG domain-containing protein n=1 Tax=Musa balbisiana TaxID=52838 RepID=A0A4S8IBP9_MUSBA|nr:hypothetical protein C4D60_Mb02t18760 [Musa balbisiana]